MFRRFLPRTRGGMQLLTFAIIFGALLAAWAYLDPPGTMVLPPPVEKPTETPSRLQQTVQAATAAAATQTAIASNPNRPWLETNNDGYPFNQTEYDQFVHVCAVPPAGQKPKVVSYGIRATQADSGWRIQRNGPSGNEPDWVVGPQGRMLIRFVCPGQTGEGEGAVYTDVGEFRDGKFFPMRQLHRERYPEFGFPVPTPRPVATPMLTP